MSGLNPGRLTAPRMGAQVHDIQAIVGSGFAPLRHCTYVLLRIHDKVRACTWLWSVLQAGLVKSVAQLGRQDGPGAGRHSHDHIATLAFSHAGLLALDIQPCGDFPFPSAFTGGMGDPDRAQSLGDASGAPWRWCDRPVGGDTGAQAHLLLAHYHAAADDGPHAHQPGSLLSLQRLVADGGFSVVASVQTCPSYMQTVAERGLQVSTTTEPFGFRDGIAQPVIAGLRATRADAAAQRAVGSRYQDRVVAPGEFVLGHPNEYGELSYCPDVDGWPARSNADGSTSRFALNGSYLVVRQIVQRVAEFQAFEAAHPAVGTEPSLAEKMVGRRKDGQPLVQCPFAPADLDAFRYRTADMDGFQCPRGAHVRRTNPRDTLGWDVESGVAASKLHRLLRRGRVYAATAKSCNRAGALACGDAQHMQATTDAPQCAEGLFFMALNADFERQFEFIQERWISNRQFGDLSGEDDLTSAAPGGHAFGVPGVPMGRRHEGIARFTEVVGGGYFFLPGLAALQFIASGVRPGLAGGPVRAAASAIG